MGFANNFQASPLYSMRTESSYHHRRVASHSVDADAWCKQALELKNKVVWLGPVYTEHHHQCCRQLCDMMLVILFSLKEMESLQTGFATHFRATLLCSKRTELLMSPQSCCCSADTDAWCKRALLLPLPMMFSVFIA